MKTLQKNICLLLIAGFASACNDDFMERYPLSSLSPETYFTTEEELKAYCNGFYSILPDIVNSFQSIEQGDDIAMNYVLSEMQGSRITPASGGGWDWTQLRGINFLLENTYKCEDENLRNRYNALGRFWRAVFYYAKLQRFGKVPWYDKTLTQDDEGLTKPRDSRETVFAHMLEDIDNAVEYLWTEKNATSISKWTALAMKSRMCLFEGAFRKYHGINGWEDILRECVKASEELMTHSGYTVYTSSPNTAYWEMFLTEEPNPEFILAVTYNSSIPYDHYINLHLQGPSASHVGMTRSLFDSYLNIDGTRFTALPAYRTMPFYQSVQGRDPRLNQSIRTAGYHYPGQTQTLKPDFTACSTGYMVSKYVTNVTTTNGTNAISQFRYAEVLLNYAEAKAELGEITQADVDKSIKLLRDRVNMPNLNVAASNTSPDPVLAEQYPRVTGNYKGVILEIRRERRIELFCEGFRWPDILRWKEGQLLTRPFKGAYFDGTGDFDLDNDGTIDLRIYSGATPAPVAGRQDILLSNLNLENGASGQIVVNPAIEKSWDEEKDYFYPIPLQELYLNKNLDQNIGWAWE
jgi:hypothetical protein